MCVCVCVCSGSSDRVGGTRDSTTFWHVASGLSVFLKCVWSGALKVGECFLDDARISQRRRGGKGSGVREKSFQHLLRDLFGRQFAHPDHGKNLHTGDLNLLWR